MTALCPLSSLVKFGPLIPKNCSGIWAPLKLDGENAGKSSITAADCSISLKFCTTADALHKFKIEWSKVKVFILTYRTQQCNRTRFG